MGAKDFGVFVEELRGNFKSLLVENGTESIETVREFATEAFESCTSALEEDCIIENLTEVFQEYLDEIRKE